MKPTGCQCKLSNKRKKLVYSQDIGAIEPVFAIVTLMKRYIELIRFFYQLGLELYNELFFLLQLLL